MTLVLAVRCRDGVVLGSDGQATTDAAGQPTRERVRKLFTVGGRIAWGAAGSVGLQQALAAELDRRHDELLAAADLRAALTRIVVPIQRQALLDFVALPGAQAPDLACIFCWWDPERGTSILSLPRTGADHQLHDRWAAIGSGEIFAAFAMASAAHLGTAQMTVEQAKVVAYKAIADAIRVAAVFLGPPIQMHVVSRAGAVEIPSAELEGGIAAAVHAWEARQHEALLALASAPPGGAEAPPPGRAEAPRVAAGAEPRGASLLSVLRAVAGSA